MRRHALFLFVLVADLALGVVAPELGRRAAATSASYLVEMLLILPPIFVLVGLLDVWVPRQVIVKNVGPKSGIRGPAISVLAGTAAAGPLYGAFPVAESLLKKGCSTFNACVLLCTWAAVKIPMIMMEVKYLGWEFSLARLVLTLPSIIVLSWLVQRAAPGDIVVCRDPEG